MNYVCTTCGQRVTTIGKDQSTLGKAFAHSFREACVKLSKRPNALQSQSVMRDGIAVGGWGGFANPDMFNETELTYYGLQLSEGREYTFQPAGLWDHEYAPTLRPQEMGS